MGGGLELRKRTIASDEKVTYGCKSISMASRIIR